MTRGGEARHYSGAARAIFELVELVAVAGYSLVKGWEAAKGQEKDQKRHAARALRRESALAYPTEHAPSPRLAVQFGLVTTPYSLIVLSLLCTAQPRRCSAPLQPLTKTLSSKSIGIPSSLLSAGTTDLPPPVLADSALCLLGAPPPFPPIVVTSAMACEIGAPAILLSRAACCCASSPGQR